MWNSKYRYFLLCTGFFFSKFLMGTKTFSVPIGPAARIGGLGKKIPLKPKLLFPPPPFLVFWHEIKLPAWCSFFKPKKKSFKKSGRMSKGGGVGVSQSFVGWRYPQFPQGKNADALACSANHFINICRYQFTSYSVHLKILALTIEINQDGGKYIFITIRTHNTKSFRMWCNLL